MTEERRFPILFDYYHRTRAELEGLGCPQSVPWALVEPHELQAKKNHGQTLERLAERGGLSPSELVAVLRGEQLSVVMARPDRDAVPMLLELLST